MPFMRASLATLVPELRLLVPGTTGVGQALDGGQAPLRRGVRRYARGLVDGIQYRGRLDAIRREFLTRTVAASSFGEFFPGARCERGVLLPKRCIRGQARVSLLEVDAAETFAERRFLLSVGSVVQLAVEQPCALEFRNVDELDEFGTDLGQSES